MKRFILYVLGVSDKGHDTDWIKWGSYKQRQSAEQGMNDLMLYHNDRHWKIVDRRDNSTSYF